MATHNTITNVPFSFEVLDAGMVSNTVSVLATAKWQPIIQVNTGGINMRIDGLQVVFEADDASTQTFVIGSVTLNSDSPSPDYRGPIALFPDLNYSLPPTSNALASVIVSGTFTYDYGSTSPINGITAFTAGVRYNSNGAEAAGLIDIDGNDPSGSSTDVSTFNGANNTCVVGKDEKVIRYGPQKIKFHRTYTAVTAKCVSSLDAPV